MYRLFAIAMIACSALYAADSSLAYNKPARADASKQNCRSPYGVFVDASFLYWYAAQDGMTIAYSGDDVDSLGTYPSPVVVFLNQPFEYKPGFKVGVGYSAKEWEAKAEYTWIRNQTSVSAGVSGNPTFGEGNIPVWVSDWFASGYIPTQNISSSWKLSIDRLDVTGGKSYFQNQLAPYAGVRALWIRQSLLVTESLPLGGEGLAPGAISHSHTNCWGLGPLCGVSGRCPVGVGFALEANAGASILFTQYTTLSRTENNVMNFEDTPESDLTFLKLLIDDYNCVRPTANLGLGLGWERNFCKGEYHLYFAAAYDFNVFWNQNMLHYVQDAYSNTLSMNDLFLQGLTLNGRFDF